VSDPDDRTNEPALPEDAHGEDAERPVADEADAHDPKPERDADRDVTTEDDDEERISDPGGDSDPQPSET
jgi:hypothetical protein